MKLVRTLLCHRGRASAPCGLLSGARRSKLSSPRFVERPRSQTSVFSHLGLSFLKSLSQLVFFVNGSNLVCKVVVWRDVLWCIGECSGSPWKRCRPQSLQHNNTLEALKLKV